MTKNKLCIPALVAAAVIFAGPFEALSLDTVEPYALGLSTYELGLALSTDEAGELHASHAQLVGLGILPWLSASLGVAVESADDGPSLEVDQRWQVGDEHPAIAFDVWTGLGWSGLLSAGNEIAWYLGAEINTGTYQDVSPGLFVQSQIDFSPQGFEQWQLVAGLHRAIQKSNSVVELLLGLEYLLEASTTHHLGPAAGLNLMLHPAIEWANSVAYSKHLGGAGTGTISIRSGFIVDASLF